ncbi:hypothetical protein CDAR_284161 [Caerostris darwini]|uniref:Uncharacterized protein n=1 Tax=Caerostris darwini TaxID=1538125 RepID=A0AAV4PR72_9ARAC|nr:hypothetical protein CDAR_284161 [Caerostris darwini]
MRHWADRGMSGPGFIMKETGYQYTQILHPPSKDEHQLRVLRGKTLISLIYPQISGSSSTFLEFIQIYRAPVVSRVDLSHTFGSFLLSMRTW